MSLKESDYLINAYNLKNIFQPEKKLTIYFESADTEQNARLFLVGGFEKTVIFKFILNNEIFDIYADFSVDKQKKQLTGI